jgi:hypothetical protein
VSRWTDEDSKRYREELKRRAAEGDEEAQKTIDWFAEHCPPKTFDPWVKL